MPLIIFSILSLLLDVKPAYSLPADDVIPLVDEEYYPQVHKALTNAKKSILCVMFMAKLDPKHTGGDEYQLVLDLINAHKRGVNVQVIFDQNVKFWEKGKKRNVIEKKSEYAYKLLSRNGVPVFYDDENKVTHNKILVIDKYITIIGSTNWTYGALRKNHEASVMIKSKSVARAFEKKLEKIEKEH
ncbi:MAG: phospholipase D/transphosphatidylase [Candidatus Scalindua rubra]|uniref:phospholipase D n=1 Tax=Candidatus Scalindua rubra TaxID=1872076 RepID=A0A1E3XD72_9BACT|nr:MAG: phospholipase D/transphosphatidylase [Candidatus Scalindua rubra]